MFMPFQHCPHLGGKKVASTSCYSFQISAKLYYDEVKTSLSVDCSLKCLQERSLPQKTLAQKVYVIVVTCAQSWKVNHEKSTTSCTFLRQDCVIPWLLWLPLSPRVWHSGWKSTNSIRHLPVRGHQQWIWDTLLFQGSDVFQRNWSRHYSFLFRLRGQW